MDRIVSIEKCQSIEPYYDLTVEGAHHYVAEGMYHHNTGKTFAILCILAKRAAAHPGSRFLVVRSSRTRLTDSAIATFVDQVLPAFGWPVPTCSREQISTYTCPSGSQFIFQGLDDPNRQQSVECAGVYVVEGVEIPSLDTITALAASMRGLIPRRPP